MRPSEALEALNYAPDLARALLVARVAESQPPSKEFREELHPRDTEGRFSETPGGGGAGGEGDDLGGHAGTPKDPVPCGDNIEKAALLISDGYNVTLNQPDQVATLLDELQKTVQEAQAAGEDAPDFDLCKVSVPGTNLFCQDSIKRSDGTLIKRIEMPQLSTKNPIPGSYADKQPRDKKGEVNLTREFAEYLAETGRNPTDTTIDASHLRASQYYLQGDKVAGIADAMAAGKIDPNDPGGRIYVTEDNYVIDGHHRWAAAVAESYRTGEPLEIPVTVVHTDIGSALTIANYWTEEQGIPPSAGQQKKAYEGVLAEVLEFLKSGGDAPLALAALKAARFVEELHPRDEEGRWTETGGSGKDPLEGVKLTIGTLDEVEQKTVRETLGRLMEKYPEVAPLIKTVAAKPLKNVWGQYDDRGVMSLTNLGKKRDDMHDPDLVGTVTHEFGHAMFRNLAGLTEPSEPLEGRPPSFNRQLDSGIPVSVIRENIRQWNERVAEYNAALRERQARVDELVADMHREIRNELGHDPERIQAQLVAEFAGGPGYVATGNGVISYSQYLNGEPEEILAQAFAHYETGEHGVIADIVGHAIDEHYGVTS